MVREHLPLQQGLRPFHPVTLALPVTGQRASSITTRIKTPPCHPSSSWGHRQRASSITTRIKTLPWDVQTPMIFVVREHLPLQQGLRQRPQSDASRSLHVREHLPLQQGLRLQQFRRKAFGLTVREHLPLQQGLRPYTPKFFSCSSKVREHLPLQQGLRHFQPPIERILSIQSESIFHYNKD